MANTYSKEYVKECLADKLDYYDNIDELEEALYEFSDGLVDVYTNDLVQWSVDHVQYVDEALSEFEPESYSQLLMYAQSLFYAELAHEALDELRAEQ